jgi:hypothetical protein
MAFKVGASHLSARYSKHQAIAKSRLSGASGIMRGDSATPGHGHPALPKQTAPGVNKTQTVQKDINKSHGFPAQNRVMLNKKTLQRDLNASKGGVKKPGSK